MFSLSVLCVHVFVLIWIFVALSYRSFEFLWFRAMGFNFYRSAKRSPWSVSGGGQGEILYWDMIHELAVRETTWYKEPTTATTIKNPPKGQNLEWGEKCSLAKRTQDVREHQEQQQKLSSRQEDAGTGPVHLSFIQKLSRTEIFSHGGWVRPIKVDCWKLSYLQASK